ncbi:MAG: hypothetical protein CVU00_02395 [Bacteroidetes bacterium HGW-Bacteroidetes-17]|jgi:branched-chain amino acid transport system substrate-binding protein|nr:MAG: hypothetical protein CVU00_02395 [Bacteroidetes bacterium HGW-Bacteroidetes-17]
MKKNGLFILLIACAAISVGILYFASTRHDVDIINIASLLPFDGSEADHGEMMRKGQILAMEEINAKSIKKTDSLNISFYNTSLKKDIALDKMKEANGKGINFFVEIYGSGQAEHCFNYAIEKNIFILSGVNTKPDLVELGNGSFYRIMPNDATASKIILNWAIDLSLQRVAVVYANDDWGKGLKDATVKNAPNYGIQITDTRDVVKNQPSFVAIVNQLKALQADGVFLFLYADDGGKFLKEAQRQEFKTKFFATENFSGTKVVENAKDAVEGIMMVVPASSEQSSLYENFTQKYTKRYNEKPTIFSIKGYDAVNVLYEIILASNSDVEKAKSLIKSYKGIGASGEISFDQLGEFIPGNYDRMVFKKTNNTYEPIVINK